MKRKWGAFTLIELLVVMAIVSVLVSIVAPRYYSGVSKAEEAVLRENLRLTRDALDRYRADIGAYPNSLDDLVNRRYLRKLPYDPIVKSERKWLVIRPPSGTNGRVYDIRSSAAGKSLDGTPYSRL